MPDPEPPHSLDEMLDRIDAARERDHDRDDGRVAMGTIFDLVGRRSFGPLMLLAGVIVETPLLGDIPGVPTSTGIFVILISVQLMLGHEHFWLPEWMLKRTVAADKLETAVRKMRKPARFIDRYLRRRLTRFSGPSAPYAMALVGSVIALGMPATEVVPFSSNIAGAALIAFGLSLVTHDGLLGLIGFALSAATVGFVVFVVF